MNELEEIARSARALLEWEDELGGLGLPEASREHAQEPTEQGSKAVSAERPTLDVLQAKARRCTACRLHEGRTKSVFARGNTRTELMFIGEGPGYHEDQRGLPFVGRAGELLDKMVAAMGFERDGVYIANVVKCRPPDNRTPREDEAAACLGYLEGQIAYVQPKVIVALGRCAAENLGLCDQDTRGWRGRWGEYAGIPTISTYHPAFLLRKPEMKRPVWEDLQMVLAKLGREVPKRRR